MGAASTCPRTDLPALQFMLRKRGPPQQAHHPLVQDQLVSERRAPRGCLAYSTCRMIYVSSHVPHEPVEIFLVKRTFHRSSSRFRFGRCGSIRSRRSCRTRNRACLIPRPQTVLVQDCVILLEVTRQFPPDDQTPSRAVVIRVAELFGTQPSDPPEPPGAISRQRSTSRQSPAACVGHRATPRPSAERTSPSASPASHMVRAATRSDVERLD